MGVLALGLGFVPGKQEAKMKKRRGEGGHTDSEVRTIRRRRDAVLGVVVRTIECEIDRCDLAGFDSGFGFGGWSCKGDAKDGGEESETEFHLEKGIFLTG